MRVIFDGLRKLTRCDIRVAFVEFVRGAGERFLISARGLSVAYSNAGEAPINADDAIDVEAHSRGGEPRSNPSRDGTGRRPVAVCRDPSTPIAVKPR